MKNICLLLLFMPAVSLPGESYMCDIKASATINEGDKTAYDVFETTGLNILNKMDGFSVVYSTSYDKKITLVFENGNLSIRGAGENIKKEDYKIPCEKHTPCYLSSTDSLDSVDYSTLFWLHKDLSFFLVTHSDSRNKEIGKDISWGGDNPLRTGTSTMFRGNCFPL